MFTSFPAQYTKKSKKQGRSSSIGAKMLSIVLRQLTKDLKEKTLKKNLPNIDISRYTMTQLFTEKKVSTSQTSQSL